MVPSAVRSGRQVRIPKLVLSLLISKRRRPCICDLRRVISVPSSGPDGERVMYFQSMGPLPVTYRMASCSDPEQRVCQYGQPTSPRVVQCRYILIRCFAICDIDVDQGDASGCEEESVGEFSLQRIAGSTRLSVMSVSCPSHSVG
jgi:hypothetical protein